MSDADSLTATEERYTDAHRLFLQNCALQRVMTQEATHGLWQRAVTLIHGSEGGPDESLEDFIATINEELDPLHMELRVVLDEISDAQWWILVNLKGDEIAQLATLYTPTELEAFKYLIQRIVNSDDGNFCLGSTEAINELYRESNFNNKLQTQDFLKRLIEDRWLALSRGGYYHLAPRAIVELQTYLKDEYDDAIAECSLCKEIVTKGERCRNEECDTVYHRRCAGPYIRVHHNQCPSCKTDWDRAILFGVNVAEGPQQEQSRIQVTRRSGRTDGVISAPSPEAQLDGTASEEEFENV